MSQRQTYYSQKWTNTQVTVSLKDGPKEHWRNKTFTMGRHISSTFHFTLGLEWEIIWNETLYYFLNCCKWSVQCSGTCKSSISGLGTWKFGQGLLSAEQICDSGECSQDSPTADKFLIRGDRMTNLDCQLCFSQGNLAQVSHTQKSVSVRTVP